VRFDGAAAFVEMAMVAVARSLDWAKVVPVETTVVNTSRIRIGFTIALAESEVYRLAGATLMA
jgi:hypothetical protein